MSVHYAEYADKTHRVEYIGRRQRNDCIKTIPVGRGSEPMWSFFLDGGRRSGSMLSFSPDGTGILSHSGGCVHVWDATSGETIAGPLVAEDDKPYPLSTAYLSDGRYVVVASRNGIIRKWDILTSCPVSERMMSDFQINSTCAATFAPDRKIGRAHV